MSADDGGEQWQQRYYEAVERLDRQAAEWQALESLLRQAIARLAVIAGGIDCALDERLKALREAVREGADGARLQPLVEGLTKAAYPLDDRPPAAAPWRELLEELPVPRHLHPRRRALVERLGAEDAPAAPVTEVATLIADALERPGLLQRLRPGSRGGDDALESARDLLARLTERLLGPESEPARRVREELAAARCPADLERVAGRLAEAVGIAPAATEAAPGHELLLRLLERLEIPPEFVAEVEAIRERLLAAPRASELERVLRDIAGLVSRIRSRVQDEKQDLESFLQQLTGRLRELDQSLRGSARSRRRSAEEGEALEARVRERLGDIGQSVEGATDLNELKRAMRTHVDAIGRHLQLFRSAEAARLQEAEVETQALTGRLATVEEEVQQLRERVREQRRQAEIDSLTGIPNRLAYHDRLAIEYARWSRYRNPLCLAVWDVDHFKRINDVYGHQAGDRVLRVIAKTLSGNTRASDLVARYGGEEFVMLLPETGLEAALQVAEKLRLAVAACRFRYHDEPVQVTVSCGLAEFEPGDDADAVFGRADAALYRAKAEGRNRCLGEARAP